MNFFKKAFRVVGKRRLQVDDVPESSNCSFTFRVVAVLHAHREQLTTKFAHLMEGRKPLQCVEFPFFGAGWTREIYRRDSGMLAGKEDVVYRSPRGTVCRDQSALVDELHSLTGGNDPTGRPFDWPAFDFELGRINPLISKYRTQATRTTERDEMLSYLRVPVRQTGGVPSAATTKIHEIISDEPNEIHKRDDMKQSFGNRTGKPLQLFWFKRLEEERRRLTSKAEPSSPALLPEELQSAHSMFGERASLYSLLTAVQEHGNTLLVGQMHSSQPATAGSEAALQGGSRLDEDVSLYYTATQPFIKPAKVRQEVVQAHAKQVAFLREKIAELSRKVEETRKREQDAELEKLGRLVAQKRPRTEEAEQPTTAETTVANDDAAERNGKKLKVTDEDAEPAVVPTSALSIKNEPELTDGMNEEHPPDALPVAAT